VKSVDDARDQWPQIFDAIPNADDHDGCNADLLQVLLILEIRIGSEDHAESSGNRRAEQYTVSQAKPLLGMHRGYIEPGELVRKLNR